MSQFKCKLIAHCNFPPYCAALVMMMVMMMKVVLSWFVGDVVDIYQREFLALRERLHSAEQENLLRSKELNLVLDEIKRAIAEKQTLRDINRTWSSLSGKTHGVHKTSALFIRFMGSNIVTPGLTWSHLV